MTMTSCFYSVVMTKFQTYLESSDNLTDCTPDQEVEQTLDLQPDDAHLVMCDHEDACVDTLESIHSLGDIPECINV